MMEFLADIRHAVHGSYCNNYFYFILIHSVKFKYEVFEMLFCSSCLNDSFFPKYFSYLSFASVAKHTRSDNFANSF